VNAVVRWCGGAVVNGSEALSLSLLPVCAHALSLHAMRCWMLALLRWLRSAMRWLLPTGDGRRMAERPFFLIPRGALHNATIATLQHAQSVSVSRAQRAPPGR